jgi:hypothetical protein
MRFTLRCTELGAQHVRVNITVRFLDNQLAGTTVNGCDDLRVVVVSCVGFQNLSVLTTVIAENFLIHS